MNPIVSALFALITAAPAAISQIAGLWATLKPGLNATDQAAVDAVLAVLGPKTDADVALLDADADAAQT